MSGDAPKKLLIGLVMLAMAAVLTWFNAGTRLVCERSTAAAPITCEVGTWAFNQVAMRTTVMSDVRSVERKEGRTDTGPSGEGGTIVASLVFVTRDGNVTPGYFADLFADDHEAIAAFFHDVARPDIVLERSAGQQMGGSIAAVFLALGGLGLLSSALRGLFSRR